MNADPSLDPFSDGLPTIERGRIRIRAYRAADAEDVYRLYADKDATRFGYSPKMDSLDDASALITECISLAQDRTLFHFGVALRESDRIIGHATIFQWIREHRRAEVGYSIQKVEWGKGLATEAVSALLQFAFEAMDLRRIEADVDPRNIGSLRVLEKLGFVREGYLRERWQIGDDIQDGIFFGLLRRDWAIRNKTSHAAQ
jgi:[ribosomal protein S5]-alanine N-acetyltransferase